MKKFQDILSWFESPEGKAAVVAEREQAANAARAELVATINRVRSDRDAERSSLLLAKKKADQAVEAKRRELISAEAVARSAAAAVFNARQRADTAIRRAEADLIRTADPRIREFVRELRGMFSDDRHITVVRDSQKLFDQRSGKHVWEERSSYGNINAHLAAIRAAIDDALGWQLEVLTAAEVGERIATVRTRLTQTRQQAHEVVDAAA